MDGTLAYAIDSLYLEDVCKGKNLGHRRVSEVYVAGSQTAFKRSPTKLARRASR